MKKGLKTLTKFLHDSLPKLVKQFCFSCRLFQVVPYCARSVDDTTLPSLCYITMWENVAGGGGGGRASAAVCILFVWYTLCTAQDLGSLVVFVPDKNCACICSLMLRSSNIGG